MKKGEKVPDTQATTPLVVSQENPGLHVYGDDDVPEYHPHVLLFSHVFVVVALFSLRSSSSTASAADTEPGAGVGFGVHPLVPSSGVVPVSCGMRPEGS